MMNSQDRAPCPYCGEMIVPGAYKCRFCNSWLIEGGKDAVDKAMWADQEKKKCEDLLKKGSWDDCYDHVSKIVNKAPSVQWAQEILSKLKNQKIKELLGFAQKCKDSNPDKAKEIALEILVIDDGNKWAKEYLKEASLKEREGKKRIYKKNAAKEFSNKRYSHAIALCKQALSDGVGEGWTKSMLMDIGESMKASCDYSGITAITSFSNSWFAGMTNGEVVSFNIEAENIVEAGVLKFHKKKIVSLASDKDFLFAVSSDGFVSKWDKKLKLVSSWEIQGTPCSISLKGEKLLIGTLEGFVFIVDNSSLLKVFEGENGLSSVCFGEKGIYFVDLFGGLSILNDKKKKDGLKSSKKIKDFSFSAISSGKSAFSTADGYVYFEKDEWKGVSLQGSVLSICNLGKNCLVSGHFGLKVIGENDHDLGSRSTLLLASDGKDFLSYKGDNSLELWSAIRWVD